MTPFPPQVPTDLPVPPSINGAVPFVCSTKPDNGTGTIPGWASYRFFTYALMQGDTQSKLTGVYASGRMSLLLATVQLTRRPMVGHFSTEEAVTGSSPVGPRKGLLCDPRATKI